MLLSLKYTDQHTKVEQLLLNSNCHFKTIKVP